MYISIDIGGTNIRVTSADKLSELLIPEYEILDKRLLSHDFQADFDSLVDTLSKVSPIEIIAIGIAGSTNLPEWKDTDFATRLSLLFDCKE